MVSINIIRSNDWRYGAPRRSILHMQNTRSNTVYTTHNDLAPELRSKLESLLNARLADALDLEAATKQAHWNVKGPNFIALHELFDAVHTNIEEHVDTMAERIAALGGIARGTVQAAARTSSLAPYPEDLSEGVAHLEALSER